MLPQPTLYTSMASGTASPGLPVPPVPQALDPNLEQFIRQGFLVLPPAGSPQLHSQIYSKARAINAKGPEETWKLSDGVLGAIPELHQVLEVPHVRQALTSILGDGYMLHGHRHLHVSSENNQMWHKDSYWGFRKVRKHRPRWLMMLYYPQDTVIAMGPTCIMAGSQYWTKNTEQAECGEDILLPDSGVQSMFLPGSPSSQARCLLEAKANYLRQDASLVQELELTVSAGTCVLMHYDLFHRASSRKGSAAPERFLVKFQFLRTTEPQAVLDSPLGVLPSPPPAPLQLEAILEDLRAWYCGIQTERQGISLLSERAKDAEILCGDYGEAEKVAAAYRLGRVGARQLLARALTADEGTARAAAYGLTTAGPSAANAVLPLLSNASNRARRLAAFVVGETAKPEASTIATLGQALRSSDSSKEAQCELLEAIGLVGARARSLGQDDLCNSCMLEVLPYLEQSGATWAKTQTGECAAYAILLAAGLKGQVPPQVLGKLVGVITTKGDHLMANFASEVLRRSGTQPLQMQIPKQYILAGPPVTSQAEPPAKRPTHMMQSHPVASFLRSSTVKVAPWTQPETKIASYVVRHSLKDPFGQDIKALLEPLTDAWTARMDTPYVSTS
eukprot:s2876_g5.t2